MSQRLLDYARRRAGEYLRVVATYSADDYRLEYVRDDIRERHAEGEIRTIVDQLAEGEISSETMDRSFGPQYASVRLFPRACLVHLQAEDDERGVVISLNTDAAANLVEFLRGCASRWDPVAV